MQIKHALRKAGKNGLVLGLIATLMLAGCGGGGGTTNTENPPVVAVRITGTAAAGAPVANGIGYALDASTGEQIAFESPTNSSTGAYSVLLNTRTGPFLIHVQGITGGGSSVDMYSLATTANLGKTVNITPLSDVVVGYAASMRTSDIEAVCMANLGGCPALLNSIVANLALSNTGIVTAMPAAVLQAFAIDPATFNAITTAFTPNHAGVDGLLDALQIVPPAAGAGNYAINLNGVTPINLLTVPVAGTATVPATLTVPAVNPTAPTATQVTQASNLVAALAEVQTFVGGLNQAFASAAPGYPSAAAISSVLDSAFLSWGMNGSQFATAVSSGNAMSAGTQLTASALAPFASASWASSNSGPAANVTYTGNCVTTLWTYFGGNGLVNGMMSFNKTISNQTGCVGTWKMAGNQHARYLEIMPLFDSFTPAGGGTTTYNSSFQFDSSAEDIFNGMYSYLTVTGPGLTTVTNYLAKGTGVAVNVPITLRTPSWYVDPATSGGNAQNAIDNEGDSVLADCATITGSPGATPCYDSTAAIEGSVYVARFYDVSAVLLETVSHRLSGSLDVNSVPHSWYPTISSVTPAVSSLSTTAETTVTTTFTVPSGAHADWGGVYLSDGAGIFYVDEQPVTSQTTNVLIVPALGQAAVSGTASLLAPIGGKKVGAQMELSGGGSASTPPQNQNIVGSWYMSGDTTISLTFFADGTYMHSQSVTTGANMQPGVEQGTYTWDSNTGAFATGGCPAVDSNGDAGLSNATTAGTGVCGATTGTFAVNGDTATFSYNEGVVPTILTFNRVVDAANPGVGTWANMKVNGVSAGTGNSLIYTFFANGDYMQSQSILTGAGTAIGLEHGTFSLTGTAFSSVCPTVETNGAGGLSAGTGSQCVAGSGTAGMNATVTANGSTLTVINNLTPGQTITFDRVMP